MAATVRGRPPVSGAAGAARQGRRRLPREGGAARSRLVLSAGLLATVVAALGLLAGIALGRVGAARTVQPAVGQRTDAPAIPALHGRLIAQPRTVTQVARADGLRLALTVSPLLPGPNRVVIAIGDRGRAPVGARAYVEARMLGMAMRPVRLEARGTGGGRFVATVPLTMFGRWQLTLHLEQRHAAPLVRQFAVDLDLPPSLLKAVAASRGE